jgi:carbonic anhydrase
VFGPPVPPPGPSAVQRVAGPESHPGAFHPPRPRCHDGPVTDSVLNARDALAELLAGNQRFVEGHRAHPNQDAHRRAQVAQGQTPFALIFGCSDSRVAAEIIFDRGLGDLFVVRTAGHIIDNGVLGSIEFGVDLLEIPLVVVLGHDGCGAVKATMEAQATGRMPSGYVRHVVELVMLSVLTARRAGVVSVNDVVAAHAQDTALLLPERSKAIADRIADGSCAVVAMEYTLTEGKARLLSTLGDVGDVGGAVIG